MIKQKRILIVRPDRIGDVVLSTPLPREIKKKYPDSYVALLLRNYTRGVYINNPYIDKVILIDDNGYAPGSLKWFLKKRSEIRHERFTHSLTLLPTERLNYLLFFSGIPYRVGVGHKFYQFITMTKYVNRKKYIPLRHEADYCMDLARKIGIETADLTTEIFLSAEELEKVNKIRSGLLSDRKYSIGIHATSGNSAPNWKPEEYRDLIMKLKRNSSIQVVVTDNVVPLGLAGIEDVVYHVMRCGLLHSTGAESKIIWSERIIFGSDELGNLILPQNFIWGLIGVVIFCPANKDEKISENYWIKISDFKFFIQELWGRVDLANRIVSINSGLYNKIN